MTDTASSRSPRLSHEDILATILERVPLIVYAMDRAGTVTLSEGSGLRPFGFEPGGLVGTNLFALLAEDPARADDFRRVLDEGQPVHSQSIFRDAVVDSWLEPIRDEQGTLVGAAGVAFDVSALHHARQRAEVFEAFVESSGELVAYADLDGRLEYVNSAGRNMLGVADDARLTGVPVADFTTAPTRRLLRRVAVPTMLRDGHWEGELVLRHQSGRAIPVHASTFVVRDVVTREPIAMAAVMRDITQQREAAEAVQRSVDHQRALLAYLYEAQEVERRRIAEGIHDDTVQVMAAVMLRLQSLRRRVTDDPVLSAELAGLDSSVGEAAARLRSLLFELAPPFVRDDDIGTVLHRYAETVFAGEPVRPSVDVRIKEQPEDEVRDVLFRIAQEALINVRRHARASRVVLSLRDVRGGYLLRIHDDGAGIPAGTPSRQPGHLGLAGMVDRAAAVGGRCTIDPAPDGGTLVEAWLPAHLGEGRPAESDPGRLLGDILGSIGEGFVAVDDRWCLVHVNRRAAEEIGKPADELVGKDMWEVLPLLARSPYAEDIRRAFEEQVPVAVESEFADRWYEMRAYPSLRGLSVFFRDVTRERKERARSTELARTTLIGGAVLAAVTGTADLSSALRGAAAALRAASQAREVRITVRTPEGAAPLVVSDGTAAEGDDAAEYPLQALGGVVGTLAVLPAVPEDRLPPRVLGNVTRLVALRIMAGQAV